MATIAERIKELRESLGLSVDELARALSVHRSSMYRYEESNPKEKREVPISVAIRISEKYGVSLDWLAGASDVKYKEAPLNDVIKALSPEGQKQAVDFIAYIKAKENGNGK